MEGTAPDPCIRVVTVCRNDLEGLRATVASVDEQDLASFEHVIQDGASTDGTVEWIEQLASRPGRIIRSSPDRGIYDAMNTAMDGRWDLVVFLNSGDRFASPDVLSRIADSWRADRWGWAFGRARLLRADGTVVRLHELRRLPWVRFISGVRTVPHQAVVLSRSVVDAIGLHRTDIGLSADQEYLLRCWLRIEPFQLDLVVADCDASGVSAQQRAGAFARQMHAHRRELGHLILGRSFTDRAVTAVAIGWDVTKRRGGGPLRALRALRA